ncbi:MAG: tetratricopeptide repeat protein [Bacteroidetes bacterium]|nr:tetratricopeptide repeat protein [Bacteroidota bacterium]
MKTVRRTATTKKNVGPELKLHKQPAFLISSLIVLLLLIWSYSNHFNNPFYFDDAHTIENNTAIRHLSNIPRFFTDASTFSTLPANQAYRPGLTTLNAIDTKLSGGTPNAKIFHIDIFITYVVLGFLFFGFLLHIFRISFPEINYAHWLALAGTGFFMLHTANAETINYIISRDDSFSTMAVLAAFNLYFYSEMAGKKLLFLIPVFIGFFVKEPTIMFAPMLLVWIWLFGEGWKKKPNTFHLFMAFALGAILFLLSRSMTPPNWKPGGGEWYYYLATQAFVIVHYINNFILPLKLSADTDWGPVNSFTDDRVMAGAAVILLLFLLAWKCSKHQRTKPITFGILWFFLALAPTSSVFPLAEVLNDHRPFFAYIGLVIVVVCCAALLLEKAKEFQKTKIVKQLLIAFTGIVLVAHAIGTHRRNIIWQSPNSLWKDVTEKSPGNGRGWMQYGIALMGDTSKIKLDSAIICFNKGLEFYPYYSYLHINLAIAKAREGFDSEAEFHYKFALHQDTLNPECYYWYGKFLVSRGRDAEAMRLFNLGHKVSPQHDGINTFLATLQNVTPVNSNNATPIISAELLAKNNPTADNYVNLSLQYYNAARYQESADAALQAAKIDSNYALAYNNICAAYNKLGEWDKAVAAGEKALLKDPKNQRVHANLLVAKTSQMKFDSLISKAVKMHSDSQWLITSTTWYESGIYHKAIDAANEALKINPKNYDAYTNICASENQLKEWDKAIAAGEKAVALAPDNILAKNNLAEAQKGKAGAK